MNPQPVFILITAFTSQRLRSLPKLTWLPDSHKSLTLTIHHSFLYALFTLSLSFTYRSSRTIEQVTYILPKGIHFVLKECCSNKLPILLLILCTNHRLCLFYLLPYLIDIINPYKIMDFYYLTPKQIYFFFKRL